MPHRIARHAELSARLASMDDEDLGHLVRTATGTRTGIGGVTGRVDVDGTPIFVKRVPLTDLERRPENVLSTANHFDLPTSYQYGIGSAGFGAWRELAAHLETTRWVLDDACPSFPLTYHWRVLPGAGADVTAAAWRGSPAVRARLAAIASATTSVVLFLEHVPQTLHEWLTTSMPLGDVDWPWVHERLLAVVESMTGRGMVHFDVHPGNVLTDGHELFVTDFGLALSTRFALTPVEADFLEQHRDFDRRDAMKYLVNWLTDAYPVDAPPQVAAIVERHAATTATMNAFYAGLVHASSAGTTEIGPSR
jgi:hypothetical protein